MRSSRRCGTSCGTCTPTSSISPGSPWWISRSSWPGCSASLSSASTATLPCSDRRAQCSPRAFASAAHRAPLGAGRTDEYLYPALLLLLASGTVRLWAIASRHLNPAHLRVVGSVVAVVFIPLAIALIGDSIATAPPYPGVGVQALAAAVQRNAEPSDHVVVGELARYPWAYYEDRPLQLRFGPNWAAYFTVTSTDPKVFIVPSEYYEGGSHPQRWANALQGPYRIWFVESPPLSLNPTYAALLHDGWHRVRTLTAPGCAAILLERSPS